MSDILQKGCKNPRNEKPDYATIYMNKKILAEIAKNDLNLSLPAKFF